MKMLKIRKKFDFGVITKYYAFTQILVLEFDENFSFLKLQSEQDKMDGTIERFDVEKWEQFVTSNSKSIFEICMGWSGGKC